MNEASREHVAPAEAGDEPRWFKVTGPEAVKVIDRDWVRYVRIALLLAAVIISWRVQAWQEAKYDAAALRAGSATRAQRNTAFTPSPAAAPAGTLPTVRAPAPAFTAPPPAATTAAAAKTATVAASAAPGKAPTDYVVKPGDTLGGIASAMRVPLDTLMQLNEIDDPDQIKVGQVLKIPNRSRLAPATSKPDTYTVAQGDTLAGIADRFNVDATELQRINGIQNPDSIVVGAVLRIP